MRIDALVSQVLAQLQPIAGQQGQRRSPIALLASGGGGDSTSGFSRPATPVSSRTASPQSSALAGSNRATDQADLSSGAQLGSVALGEADASNGLMASIATLTDQFVRQRAIVSYSLPGKGPFGANIDVVFDVETAYRRIDLLAPVGQGLDVKA